MRDVVYHQYAKSFERHWWTEHRRSFVSRWLLAAGIAPDGAHPVLEIGSGAGTEHAYLSHFGPVTGVEINQTGLEYCRTRGYANLLAGDLNELDLPREQFDLAVDFHVLYHEWVREPGVVLRKIHASLRPNGRLVMTEPAHEFLRRGHDQAVMAARRWSRRDLRRLVEDAGFEIEHFSGFLTILLPAVLLSLLLDRLRPTHNEVGELERPSVLVDGLLRATMAVERFLMRLVSLPTGTSWALVARKR